MITLRSEKKFRFYVIAFIFLTSLSINFLASYFFNFPAFVDEKKYLEFGNELISGNLGSRHTAMPLYALAYALFGPFVSYFNITLAAFSSVILYLIGCELFLKMDLNAKVFKLFLAPCVTCYPHLIFYANTELSESFYFFLIHFGFFFFLKNRLLISIFILSLALLVRPIHEIFMVCLFFLWFFYSKKPLGFRALQGLLSFLIYVSVLSPWWVHNYEKYDQFVRLNLGGGIVLYSGNNPLNRSGGGIGGVDVDLTEFKKIQDPIVRDLELKRHSYDFISENYIRFFENGLKKITRLWRPYPFAEKFSGSFYFYTSIITFVPLYLGFILFVVWIVFHNKYRHVVFLVGVGWVGWISVVHFVTIGSVRYRFPAEGFLLVFGVTGLVIGMNILCRPILRGHIIRRLMQ